MTLRACLFFLAACGGGDVTGANDQTGTADEAASTLDTATASAIEDLLTSADAEAGSAVYQANCRRCHGADATGSATTPGIAGTEAERVIEAVLTGPGRMPTFPMLSDEDVANVAAYVSELPAP
jgi:mono/diheme cytochrome c family protein